MVKIMSSGWWDRLLMGTRCDKGQKGSERPARPELLQGLAQEIVHAGKELQDLIICRVQYYVWASQVAQRERICLTKQEKPGTQV